MRGFAAVFNREIAERRLLFLLGLFGLVPLVLPALFQAPLRADELRAVSASILAATVGAVLAVSLGSSVLARDLAERRLGFYFARPLSGWAIWAGKLAAALVLCLSIGLLVLLPALLFASGTRGDLLGVGLPRLVQGTALLAVLLLVANLMSTLIRARSPWLAFDLAAALVFGLLVWDAALRLLRAGAVSVFLARQPPGGFLLDALGEVAPLGILAVLAGSAAQVVSGRTDPRRGHRFLSLTLWSLLFAAALGLSGYSRWVVAATPGDLAAVQQVTASPAGDTLALQGHAARRGDYWPMFVVDARSGRFSRLFPAHNWTGTGAVRFAADGKSAVWFETAGPLDGPAVLVRLDLTRPGARPVPTRLTFPSPPALFALSPDGRRIATVEAGWLAVEEIATSHLLAAAAVEPGFLYQNRLRFTDADHLLYLYGPAGLRRPHSEAPLEVAELDLAKGHLEVLGRTLPVEPSALLDLSPDGSHFLVRDQETLELYRTRGAVLAAKVPDCSALSGFLADGRVLAIEVAGGPRRLALLSPEGELLRRFAFPAARALKPSGEPIPGHLVLGVTSRPAPAIQGFGRWEVLLLDLATGESRSLGRGLVPMGSLAAGPESLAPRLFLDGSGRLVLLDLPSGRRRTIVGG